MFLVSVVVCQAEVPESGWSLVQKIPTECDVSERDRVASKMRRLWLTRGSRAIKNSCVHFKINLLIGQ